MCTCLRDFCSHPVVQADTRPDSGSDNILPSYRGKEQGARSKELGARRHLPGTGVRSQERQEPAAGFRDRNQRQEQDAGRSKKEQETL